MPNPFANLNATFVPATPEEILDANRYTLTSWRLLADGGRVLASGVAWGADDGQQQAIAAMKRLGIATATVVLGQPAL